MIIYSSICRLSRYCALASVSRANRKSWVGRTAGNAGQKSAFGRLAGSGTINGHGTTHPMLSRTLASWIFRYQSSFDQCIGDLWPIRPYNTRHEMDYPSDAHCPGSPWLIRFISPETDAGRSVEKRGIRHGVYGSQFSCLGVPPPRTS